jgi:hypothetical protein
LHLPIVRPMSRIPDCSFCGAPVSWKMGRRVTCFRRSLFINHRPPKDCQKYFDHKLSVRRQHQHWQGPFLPEGLRDEIRGSESRDFAQCDICDGKIIAEAKSPTGLKLRVCELKPLASIISLYVDSKNVRSLIECMSQPFLLRRRTPDPCELMGFVQSGDCFVSKVFFCSETGTQLESL